jgi:hypothetical protein
MANKSLFARLGRLFSTNVVVRRIGKRGLKVIDSDRLQSSGNMKNTRYNDRFTRMHGIRPSMGTYNQNYNYHASRLQIYTDYEAMDTDPILASALDIYSDETTVKNAENDVLSIRSSNEEIRKILHNLFYDILNIEFNLWPWVRNMCKYGDFYLVLDIEPEVGIVNVQPISSYEVLREEGFDEKNPYAVRFVYQGSSGSGTGAKQTFENYEIAHFRLLSDSNFLPYGKSMLEAARKVWKQLILMEDAMLIHRVMRAPSKRVFKIDVGNIPPHEIDNHMNTIIDSIKKVPYVDPQTGDYNLKFNLQNMVEDFYMPVRGGQSGTEITTLEGYTGITDIDYLKHKMMAALKIPKAFLGYEEHVSGKATLAAEDVRFARTIERLQRIVVSELTKIAIVHLFTQGYEDAELVNFELSLTSPSIVYEQEKVALLKEKTQLAGDLKEKKMVSNQWIYENIYNMSKEEYELQQKNIIADLKQNFRYQQIETEGNDPAITGQSFGTAHDIASMHIAHNDINYMDNVKGPAKQEYNGGAPTKGIKAGSQHSPTGQDPLGKKDLANVFKQDENPISHKFKGGSPLKRESLTPDSKVLVKQMLASKIKTKSILKESLKVENKDPDLGTLLDEKNLIDSEK